MFSRTSRSRICHCTHTRARAHTHMYNTHTCTRTHSIIIQASRCAYVHRPLHKWCNDSYMCSSILLANDLVKRLEPVFLQSITPSEWNASQLQCCEMCQQIHNFNGSSVKIVFLVDPERQNNGQWPYLGINGCRLSMTACELPINFHQR